MWMASFSSCVCWRGCHFRPWVAFMPLLKISWVCVQSLLLDSSVCSSAHLSLCWYPMSRLRQLHSESCSQMYLPTLFFFFKFHLTWVLWISIYISESACRFLQRICLDFVWDYNSIDKYGPIDILTILSLLIHANYLSLPLFGFYLTSLSNIL